MCSELSNKQHPNLYTHTLLFVNLRTSTLIQYLIKKTRLSLEIKFIQKRQNKHLFGRKMQHIKKE